MDERKVKFHKKLDVQLISDDGTSKYDDTSEGETIG